MTLFVGAQNHPSCAENRYKLDVFENVQVTKDIQFSEAVTIGGDSQKLYMDIYEPAGDTVSKRPMIMLAFGGSFIAGTRGDIAPLCEAFAKKGYVAVSIDYRLYDLPFISFPTESDMQDVVIKAVKDMKSALRFLDDDAKGSNNYNIDMDWLYVGGISAGSITALHTAMLDSTDMYTTEVQANIDKNAPVYGISNSDSSIKIRGVINYSGGLHDASWIDANDPPMLSFHEDGDPTVPYKGGYAKVLGQNIISIDGSYVIDSAARSHAVHSVLNTINSNTHVGYFVGEEKAKATIDESARFMYKMICSESLSSREVQAPKPYTIGRYPSENILTVRLNEKGKVSLYDISGKTIAARVVDSTIDFDLRSLNTGVYILTIQIDDKIYTEKVVNR